MKTLNLHPSSFVLRDGHNEVTKEHNRFFENQPELLDPKQVSKELGVSTETIYDWKYRAKLRGIPINMFVKIGRGLRIRKSILIKWINSQNPALAGEGENL